MENYKKHQKTSNKSSENENRKKTETYPGKYIERLDPRNSAWYSGKLIREHIARYSLAAEYCKDKIVVEMGCGTGYGSKLIAYKGAKKVYAVDIDPNAILYAKKYYSDKAISFKTASALETRFKKHLADVVITFETIEHVTNPDEMIREIERVLKPGGMLILSTPNKLTSLGDNPFHLIEFTLNDLNTRLSGFTLRKYYGQGKTIPFIILLYQYITKKIHFSSIRKFLHFRPWEGYEIYPLDKKSQNLPVYIIAICRKKTNRK